MKNKAFISIYVLLILSIISLSLGFIYKQSLNNQDLNEDIYNKKKTIYKLESLNNIALSDKKRLIKFLEEVNKSNVKYKVYSYTVNYKGEDEKLFIRKISDNNFLMRREILYKNVIAESNVKLELLDKYKLDDDKKIILSDDFEDFFKNLRFDKYEFKEYTDLILNKDLSNNIKVKNELKIKKDSENISSNASSISNIDSDKRSLNNFEDNSKQALQISGIVIVDGNLVLEKDLEINGLLIISGDIISINDSKLRLNGQIIAKNDFNIDYTYAKKRSIDYINDIYNPKILKIKLKEVY